MMTSHTSNEINHWITTYLSQLLEMKPEEIDSNTRFESYGIDSTVAASLSGDLGEWLGIRLELSLIFDYPTIASLTEYLVGKCTLSAHAMGKSVHRPY
jgi:acyl carrier protein